jgi:hypothetical protein
LRSGSSFFDRIPRAVTAALPDRAASCEALGGLP